MRAIIILTWLALLSGCAYNGNVLLYSPQGDANAIEKAIDANANIMP